MEYIYIVEVHYDYECHRTVGVFSTAEEAQKVADEYMEDESVLDGAYVYKEEVWNSYEEWNKEVREVD